MPSTRYVYTKTKKVSASYLTCSEDSVGYRFGFNSMPKDNEIYGPDGSGYDFGARIYDSRLGKWLSTDPLQYKYAPLSPYVFAANAVLVFKDINGQWIGRVNEAEDGTKSIVFVAEDGDDFVTLSIQLGISMSELENGFGGIPYNTGSMTTIPEGTEISLIGLKQVQAINSYMNNSNYDNDGSNCAGFVDFVNGGNKDATWISTDVMTSKLKNQYKNVPVSEASIGDVITLESTYEDFEITNWYEAKSAGYTKEQFKEKYYEEYGMEADHFMLIILKTRDGNDIQQVMQKNGKTQMRNKVEDYPAQTPFFDNDRKGVIIFEVAPLKGDSSPIYKPQ